MGNKIAVTFFTHSGDADECLLSASIASQVLTKEGRDFQIFVNEDVFSPMPSSIREEMRAKGFIVEVTSWSRNGNLRGQSAIRGIAQHFASLYERGFNYVFKTDPDCALINSAWWDLSFPMTSPCFGEHPTYGFGGGYLLDLSYAKSIVEDLDRIPAHHTAFEDYEIPTRLVRVTGDLLSIKRYPMGTHGFAQFEANKLPMPAESILNYSNVTFGFNKGFLGTRESEKECRLIALQKVLELVTPESLTLETTSDTLPL